MGLIYRIKRKYKGMGIAKKIFLMLILVSVIPIATIFVMTYHITTKEIGSQINSLADANLQQAVSNVDNFFSEYNKIITSVYTDEAYVKYLNYCLKFCSRLKQNGKLKVLDTSVI